MGDTSNQNRAKRPSEEDLEYFSPPINKKKHTNNYNTTARMNNNATNSNFVTQGRFNNLNPDESLDDNDMNEDETVNTMLKPRRKDKVPIVIQTTDYNQQKKLQIRIAIISVAPNINLKYTKTKLTVFTINKEEHNIIVKKLKEIAIPFHTYERPDDKLKKMVLKGLPPLDEEDINNSIQEQGLTPIKISKMKTKYEETPIYQVTFEHDTEINNIMKIKFVCHVKATWRKYKNPKLLTQCYKCQEYGHGSSYCNNIPKCVKCAGNHLTKNCNLTEANSDEIKCANCGKNHVASFTGCEKYQQQLKIIQLKREATNKTQRKTADTTVVPTNNMGNFPYMRRSNTNATDQHRTVPTQQQQQQTFSQVTRGYKNNISTPNTNTSFVNDDFKDFTELTEQIKILNELCNIKQLTNELKTLNSNLAKVSLGERKIMIITQLLSKND